MNVNLIILIAVVSLAALALLLSILPFFAAIYHVTYDFNVNIITVTIAALAGIVTAVINKSIKSNDSVKSIEDQDKP